MKFYGLQRFPLRSAIIIGTGFYPGTAFTVFMGCLKMKSYLLEIEKSIGSKVRGSISISPFNAHSFNTLPIVIRPSFDGSPVFIIKQQEKMRDSDYFYSLFLDLQYKNGRCPYFFLYISDLFILIFQGRNVCRFLCRQRPI